MRVPGRTRMVACLFLAGGGLLLGCMGRMPPTHYYTLAPPQEAAEAGPEAGEGLAVGVDSFAVDPPYDQDRLVYRRGEDASKVGFHYYHRWAAAPGRLVAMAMVVGLRGTGGIGSIEPLRSTGTYDARLSGRVLYLEEVVGPGASEARVAVHLELVDAGGEVLFSGTFNGAAKTSGTDGAGTMQAVRRALDVLIREARSQLAAALARPPA